MLDMRREVGRLAVELYFAGLSAKDAVHEAAKALKYAEYLRKQVAKSE